jgi:hypothetical protein
MAIAYFCPNCKAKLKGPDQLVGRTLKCPGCSAPVTIPASAIVAAPPAAPPPAAPPALGAGLPTPPQPIKPDAGFIPRMQLDDDPPVPSQPPAAKEPVAEKKSAAPPSLLDLPDDIGFKDEPPPAPPPAPPKLEKKTPPKPEQKTPPPAPAPEKKPAESLFPNMEIDDAKEEPYSDFLSDDEEELPAEAVEDEEVAAAAVEEEEILVTPIEEEEIFVGPVEEEHTAVTADKQEEEVWVDAVSEEEEEVWVDAAADETAEDEFDVVAEEDELLDVVAVEDTLDVVAADDSDVTFRLLQLPRLHVRAQSGMFAVTNAYDLVNPKTKRKVGEAVERPESSQQILSLFVGKNVAATKIEVTEGRNRLVMTIRRAPYFMTATAEIFDADEDKLGSFEIRPFSALTGTPLWISDPKGKQIIKLEMKLFSGRRYFRNRKGKLLAEWVHELTYEKKLIKFKLAPRGNSFYLLFKELLDERPKDRMLILGASLGLDLLQMPTGQRGLGFGGT